MGNEFIATDWLNPIELEIQHAKKLPINAKFVCGLFWDSDSPGGNSRSSDYFISSNKNQKHWILWKQYPYDETSRPIEVVAAYCIRKKYSSVSWAAFHLLKASLIWESENFGELNKDYSLSRGLLSMNEVLIIEEETSKEKRQKREEENFVNPAQTQLEF